MTLSILTQGLNGLRGPSDLLDIRVIGIALAILASRVLSSNDRIEVIYFPTLVLM